MKNSYTQKESSQPEKLPSEVLKVVSEDETESGDSGGRVSQFEIVMDIANECSFWKDQEGVACVTIKVDTHAEHHRIGSRAFDLWIRSEVYRSCEMGVSSEAMKKVMLTLEAKALATGECHTGFTRVGRDEKDDVWIDLCDDKWRAIHISKSGWKVVSNPPVRFMRQDGMNALPDAEGGGELSELFKWVNCAEEDQILIAGFLLGAFHPEGPYYGLSIHGGKGCAKTTATRILRSLCDPNTAPTQSFPKNQQDMAVAVQGQHVLAFENISRISDAESDWLCRLSTGEAFRTRTLFTNTGETILKLIGPWMINGIPDAVTRGDLVDRALSVELKPIDRTQRLEESEVFAEVEKIRPGVLGALCTAIGTGLREIENVRQEFKGQLPRMADSAIWITAAESALGFETGSFIKRHEEMSRKACADSVESDPVALTIIRLAGSGTWEGSMKELLEQVKFDHEGDRFLPRSPKAIGTAVKRCKDQLKEGMGIIVENLRRSSKGYRVRISKEVQNVHDVHSDNETEVNRDEQLNSSVNVVSHSSPLVS